MQCSHLRVIRLCTTASRRCNSTTTRPTLPADDFLCIPRFFDLAEQHALLSAALRKLDAAEPRASRRRRRDFLASHRQESQDHHQWKDIIGDLVVENAFLPDELYHFEEGHYDGVIRRYREMRVSTWDDERHPVLKSALNRLETLYPDASPTQTHLLHLASDGEIHPHVDNVGASGSWILGVSLGSERTLRMESVEDVVDGIPKQTFDVSLSSGSVYIQKNSVRYNYKHSILHANSTLGGKVSRGQRMSIMIRDCPPPTVSQKEASHLVPGYKNTLE